MTGRDGNESPPIGSVRPLDEFGNPIDSLPLKSTNRRRPWLAFGAAALAVVAVGVAGALFFWTSVVRGPLGAAEVIPVSADIVVTVDALELIEGDRFARLIDAFAPAGVDVNIEEFLADVDDDLEDEFGVRFFDDITGWMGRSAAFAVWIPDDALTGATVDEVGFAVSLMVRNDDGARAVIDQLIDLAREDGAEVTTTDVLGTEVTVLTDGLETVHLALDKNRFLFANDAIRIREMIQPETSIIDSSAFDRLWDAVNGEEAVATAFVSDDLIGRIGNVAAGTQSALTDLPTGAAMGSLLLDDDGLAMEFASVALDAQVGAAGSWIEDLPAGTFGYISADLGEDLDLGQSALEQFRSLGDALTLDAPEPADVDFDELEREFVGEVNSFLGFDVIEVLDQFTDQVILAAIPTTGDGVAPGVGLGLAGAVGVEDAGVVEGALAALVPIADESGLPITALGESTYAIDAAGIGILYGVVNDRLVLASDGDSLSAVTDGPGGLATDAEWRRIADLVGEDMPFYVNIAALISEFDDGSDEVEQLEPLRSIGAGQTVRDGLVVVSVRLIIDY